MLINDIFPEPVFEAIKPSDIPPGMRQRLTMKDIEAERPAGAFRYRVMFPDGTHSDFMSLQPAQQAAALEKGRIIDLAQKKNLTEQAEKIRQGLANFYILAKYSNDDRPFDITLDGKPFRVADKYTKRALIHMYNRAVDKDSKLKRQAANNPPKDLFDQPPMEYERGRGPNLTRFLIDMSTQAGFNKILAPARDEIRDLLRKDKLAKQQDKDQKDLPQSYNDEDLVEEQERTPQTQRYLTRLRMKYPQAASDMEALAYDHEARQRQSQAAIDKLEKELDDVESDSLADLRRQIDSLKQRKGQIAKRGQDKTAADDRQDALLKKLDDINRAQDAAIDDLEKEVDQLEKNLQPPAAQKAEPQTVSPAADVARAKAPVKQPAPAAKPAPKPSLNLAQPIGPEQPDWEQLGIGDIEKQREKRQTTAQPQLRAVGQNESRAPVKSLNRN